MANYMHTTEPGTSRRRASQIIINNPAQPLIDDGSAPAVASVKFVMQDRIVMADGSEMFIEVGTLTRNLDADTLAKLYPSVNADTGVINHDSQRYGGQLMAIIIDALEDFFIKEGMEQDAQLNTTEEG